MDGCQGVSWISWVEGVRDQLGGGCEGAVGVEGVKV